MLSESATPGPRLRANATEILAAQVASGSGQTAGAKRLAIVTNKAARDVAGSLKRLRKLQGQQASLRRNYNAQLAELDKLGRLRASWNRDRQISKKKSASASLGRKLAALEKSLRKARSTLIMRRHTLLGAVQSELRGSVQGKRGVELRRLKTALTARLHPKARRIILPDASLDRLADPEELEEQAALIARAERQLRAEDERLEERYRYYVKQTKLRAQSERATEIARRDDESIRRSPGLRSDRNSGLGGADPESSPDSNDGTDGTDNGGGEPPSDDSRDLTLESSSVILADVVDDVTAADLRRAGRRADPSARVRAAKRARVQLKRKLDRLKRQRALIEKRAKELRTR